MTTNGNFVISKASFCFTAAYSMEEIVRQKAGDSESSLAQWDAVDLRRHFVLQDAEAAAKKLTEEAFSRGSNDNISCIVLRFKF